MNEGQRPANGAVFQLMYRSRDHLSPDERRSELGDLFSQARSNNERRHITGALLLSGPWFVQVLEGDEAPVRSLFAAITTDPRHDGVELLFEGWTDARAFSRWSMANVTMPDSDIPLIAQISEIAPAGSRQMTPAMSRLLAKMQAAADQPIA